MTQIAILYSSLGVRRVVHRELLSGEVPHTIVRDGISYDLEDERESVKDGEREFRYVERVDSDELYRDQLLAEDELLD